MSMTSESQWCRDTFDIVANGGIWLVPRSGLTFRKNGEDTLTLESRDGMPDAVIDPELWKAYQEDDFQVIKLHLEGAGISVFDTTDGIVGGGLI